MNDRFIKRFVVNASIDLFAGYSLKYISVNQWTLRNENTGREFKGTLEECCDEYENNTEGISYR